MIASKSVVFLLLLVVAVASSSAVAAKVEGECDAHNADGTCDSAEDVAAAVPDAAKARACEDKEAECKYWSDMGECDNNPEYMLRE